MLESKRAILEVAQDGWRTRAAASVGSISFVSSAHQVSISVSSGTAGLAIAAVPSPLLELACGDIPSCFKPVVCERRPKAWAAMRMVAESSVTRRKEVQALLDRLLARTLAREFGSVRLRSDDAWLSPAALERVASTAHRAGGRLSLAAMAHEAGLSVSAFSRAFRGATGLTAGAWLIEQRMKVAERLLVDTDLSMESVARDAGISGAAHLAQLFRARRACTPGEFRARSRAGR